MNNKTRKSTVTGSSNKLREVLIDEKMTNHLRRFGNLYMRSEYANSEKTDDIRTTINS